MKRLLLLPALLLSANAASAQSVFLKCSSGVDGYTATGVHDFAINPVTDSISWADGDKTHKPVSKGVLIITPKSYYGVFPGRFPTKVQISRVDGRFALKKYFGAVGVVETNGQCSEAAAPKMKF